jgi:pyruvate kinase
MPESRAAVAQRCADALGRLRAELLDIEQRHAKLIEERSASAPSLRNFLHYLALRQSDVRTLQEDLARLGLSSLGRAESHVLYTIDAVLQALDALTGARGLRLEAAGAPSYDEGHRLLEQHTHALLGARPRGRDVGIMVTLSAETLDAAFARALVAAGMNVARINCAHDDPDVWARMVEVLRGAGRGRSLRIQMDLAGPKLRIGPCTGDIFLRATDLLRLTRAQEPGGPATIGPEATFRPAYAPCTPPEILDGLRPGERIFFDDGKIAGAVESVDSDGADIRIVQAKTRGARLGADDGINVPDSAVRLPALSEKDRADLGRVVKLADIVGLSFAQRPEDIADIEAELAHLGAPHLGLVLKIETRRGFAELPNLLLAALGPRPLGVMIARGDMAVECGYERLAEIQEEMLWLCEAAHVPVIWATQVLDRLARKGLPTRAEITDAAMSERAECVMLNKGPYVLEAIELLDRILRRMESHQRKKSATLRPLSVSRSIR